MDQTDTNLWKYRLEKLEEEVCEHGKMIKANTEKINEHDKLIDRVGLKLDQIGNNVIEVKATLTKMTEKRENELEEDAGRPKKLWWDVIKGVALALAGAAMALLLK